MTSIGNRQSEFENPSPASGENPWLGLASFTEEARALFHGRDDEVADLARRVRRKQLTVLFGQSGLGKTSLIHAGLVPALRPDGYCPIYLRFHYEPDAPPPTEQIKQAVHRVTAEAGTWTKPGSAQPGETLWEFFHHRDDVLRDASGRVLTPLLIFDQFEEVFTLAQSDDAGRARAQAFLADLADLVENRATLALEQDETAVERFDFARADYRVLISLREDYLANLEGLKGLMPSVTQNRVRLTRMNGPQALDAVLRPGAGIVSEEVARAIVRFVAGGAEIERAEVEPSLLSLVCRQLNETRLARGAAEISADLLAGSHDTILSEFYERAVAGQPAGVRQFIEERLLTDSGFRESVAEERVRKAFADAGAAGALSALVDRRLLRIEERLDVRRVELTHDVLCGVVAASRDTRHTREAKAEAARQLAASQAREQTTRRALWHARLIATGCAVLALAAIGSAIFGYLNLCRAREANRRAETTRGQAESLVRFMMKDLRPGLEDRGGLKLLRASTEAAIRYYEALPAASRDVKTEQGYATALETMIRIRMSAGASTGLEDAWRAACELRRKIAAEIPNDPDAAADLLGDEHWRMSVVGDTKAQTDPRLRKEFIARWQQLRARFPASVAVKKGLADALTDLLWYTVNPWIGMYLPEEAQPTAKELGQLIDEWSAASPNDRDLPYYKWIGLYAQATILENDGHGKDAMLLYEKALAEADKAWRADPGSLTLRARVAYSKRNLAEAEIGISHQRAVSIEREARESFRQLMELDPANKDYALWFAEMHFIECQYLAWRDSVIEPARKAFREWDALAEPFRESSEWVRRYRWWRCTWQAALAARAGDLADARAQIAEAQIRFDYCRDRLPDDPRIRRNARIEFLQDLGEPLPAMYDWPALERVAREDLALVEAALREEPNDPDRLVGRPLALAFLGQALLREGRSDEAAPILEQAVAGFRDTALTPTSYWAADFHQTARECLAEILMQRGDAVRARDLLELARKARETRIEKEQGSWLRREYLAATLVQLGSTYSVTDPAEKVRRTELLDRAWAILDSPEAEGRISVQGKETKAKVEALRAAAQPH